jgi:Phosphopantetheine attachment site
MSQTPATDDTVQVLAEFWEELLDLDSAEPGGRLLELGGNSLTATMLANRIELAFGFRPALETLLNDTFGELSELCARMRVS